MNDFEDLIDFEDDYDDDEDMEKDRYLCFLIADGNYAIDISVVTEIIGIQKITSVPDKRNYIKGITNLRGNIIPVIDLRLRFALPSVEFDEKTCIIVVNSNNGSSIGLIVDMVAEVLIIPEEMITPAPKTNKGTQSKFIQGVGKFGDQVQLILDLEKLLFDDK